MCVCVCSYFDAFVQIIETEWAGDWAAYQNIENDFVSFFVCVQGTADAFQGEWSGDVEGWKVIGIGSKQECSFR